MYIGSYRVLPDLDNVRALVACALRFGFSLPDYTSFDDVPVRDVG